MKRIACLLSILFIAFIFTGCGTELTNEETKIIAEYIADLLLKYDANYESQYEVTTEEEVITTEVITEHTTDEITTEEVTTEESTTEEATNDVGDSLTEDEDAGTTEDDDSANGDLDIPPFDDGSILDIAEVVGMDGISITYNRCMFLDRYPSLDQNGAFIYLEADPGYKLVVLKFDIENQTSRDAMVNLLDTDISYRLILNETKAAKPMLTILMDDLGTFKSAIPANSEQSAVLVFQMSDSLIESIQSLVVRVAYKDEEYTIYVQ